MNLFDETESKYYEILTYLLYQESSITHKEIDEYISSYLPGEADFEVTGALFSAPEGEELIYMENAEGRMVPVLEKPFPIRNGRIEKEALKSLISNPYVSHFLTAGTLEKLHRATEHVEADWDPNDITIKNMFFNGASCTNDAYNHDIALIATAIREGKAIRYDYIRPGRIEKLSVEVYPVGIEFSLVNDRFRICAYNSEERRFVKMNLDSMINIIDTDQVSDIDLLEEYKEFIRLNTKKVVLDVEPVSHVIERCFRVFSYYDRKARYDKEGNKYRLEISYFKADEKEVIKNILSMGSYVVVTEPRTIQKEVHRRIMAAAQLYG